MKEFYKFKSFRLDPSLSPHPPQPRPPSALLSQDPHSHPANQPAHPAQAYPNPLTQPPAALIPLPRPTVPTFAHPATGWVQRPHPHPPTTRPRPRHNPTIQRHPPPSPPIPPTTSITTFRWPVVRVTPSPSTQSSPSNLAQPTYSSTASQPSLVANWGCLTAARLHVMLKNFSFSIVKLQVLSSTRVFM